MAGVAEFEMDGVRCFWAESDGPMTAGVVFGVGMTDEGFAQRGLTHLIEHMSLHDIARTTSHNGSVDFTNTTFHCRGTLADVQGFFQSALHALNNPPYHDLERESRVLAAESARKPGSFFLDVLAATYGFVGPGAVTLPEAGLKIVTPERLESWKRHWFVKHNAAAFFHGPRPEGISLAGIPDGPRPGHTPPNRVLEATPMVYRSHCAGPTVITQMARGGASGTILAVAAERLTQRLRGEMGVSYDVSSSVQEIDTQTLLIALAADATPEHQQKVFETMRLELERLANEGPTGEEVQFFVAQADRAYSGELGDASLAEVLERSRYFSQGRPYLSYPEHRAILAQTPLTEYGAPLRDALEIATWVIPQEMDLVDRRLVAMPHFSKTAAEGQVFPSNYNDSELHVGERSLSLKFVEASGSYTATLGEIHGVSTYDDGGVCFYTAEGFTIRFVPSDFAAEGAVRDFVSRVSPELIVPAGEKLRSDEATAALVPKEKAKEKSKKGFRERRKKARNKGEQQAAAVFEDFPVAVPGRNVSLGHAGAIRFAEAIVASDWGRAEHVWAETHKRDQAHLVLVGSSTGGNPSRLDPWVEGSSNPGVALTIRGAMRVTWAWDARTGATSDQVAAQQFEEFFARLRGAEADLVIATEALPDSSAPWEPYLNSGLGLQISRPEIEERYINHVQRGASLRGHLAFQRYVSKKWFGSHEDMWEHAEFVVKSSPDGSPHHAIAPAAFIQHWFDEGKSTTEGGIYETAGQMLGAIGKVQLLDQASKQSHSSTAFRDGDIESANAMEEFYTFFICMEAWKWAAQLLPKIGNRYSGNSLTYFTQQPFEEIARQVNWHASQQAA